MYLKIPCIVEILTTKETKYMSIHTYVYKITALSLLPSKVCQFACKSAEGQNCRLHISYGNESSDIRPVMLLVQLMNFQ